MSEVTEDALNPVDRDRVAAAKRLEVEQWHNLVVLRQRDPLAAMGYKKPTEEMESRMGKRDQQLSEQVERLLRVTYARYHGMRQHSLEEALATVAQDLGQEEGGDGEMAEAEAKALELVRDELTRTAADQATFGVYSGALQRAWKRVSVSGVQVDDEGIGVV